MTTTPGPSACPVSFPAERGTVVWTRNLQWGLVSGLLAVSQYGSNGQRGRAAELTARLAGAAHCCVSCGHTIPREALYGLSLSGLIHYCACCVTVERPEDQFKTGRAAA